MKEWIGEYRTVPSCAWIEGRLAASECELSREEITAGISFYIKVFAPVGYEMPVSFFKQKVRQRNKPKKRFGLSEDDAGSVRWEQTAIDPGGYATSLRYGHLLGVLWRGLVAHALGSGRPVKRERLECLFENPHDGLLECSGNPALRSALGRGNRPGHSHLRVSQPARWWWCFPSQATARHVVIDLDVHDDAAQETLAARLELVMSLTVKPHLIVRSRDGRGLHVFYLLDNQPGWPRSYTVARSLRVVLERRVPGITGSGVIEVFPKGGERKATMPAYPFGPNSFLCDRRGNVVEDHPLRSLAKWRADLGELNRYTLADFKDVRCGALRVSTLAALRKLVDGHRKTEKASAAQTLAVKSQPADGGVCGVVPAEDVQSEAVPVMSAGEARGTASTEKLVAACSRLPAWPPVRGGVNELLLQMARFLKFDAACSQDRAVAVMERVLGQLVDSRHPLKEYRLRFTSLFASAKARMFTARRASAPTGIDLLLSREDVENIGRRVANDQRIDLGRRKVVLQLWLLIAGTARRSGHIAGRSSVPVSSTAMQAIHRSYKKHLIWLTNFGGVERGHKTWEITLPKTSAAQDAISSHAELWAFLVENLPEKVGKKIAGERNWRNWKRGK